MKSHILFLITFLIYSTAFSQSNAETVSNYGIEVDYEVKFSQTIEKRKAEKNRDEYIIVGTVKNQNGEQLFNTKSSIVSINVANGTKNSNNNVVGRSTRWSTRTASTLFAFFEREKNFFFAFDDVMKQPDP